MSVPATRSSTSLQSAVRRKILVRKAKLAEGVRRYDQMVQFMKEVVQATDQGADLSAKERCLLGVAVKNFVKERRNSHLSTANQTRSWLDHFKGSLAATYLLTSKTEFYCAFSQILRLIDFRLLPVAVSVESKVFYLTLKGDVSWSMADVMGELDGLGHAAIANFAYVQAWGMTTRLDSRNPHRLSFLVSVAEYFLFFHNSPVKALAVLKRVLDILPISSPGTLPAVSLLSFEGGLQLTAHVLKLNQMLQNLLQGRAEGHSNLPAGNAAGPAAGNAAVPAAGTAAGNP